MRFNSSVVFFFLIVFISYSNAYAFESNSKGEINAFDSQSRNSLSQGGNSICFRETHSIDFNNYKIFIKSLILH